MRRLPAPERVTRPPPSITIFGWVFTTLAVAVMVIVTGVGPQLNVMMPPAATALTTALDVQLDGVPVPITRVGCEVSTACAAAGMLEWPDGLAQVAGFDVASVEGEALGLGDGFADGVLLADGLAGAVVGAADVVVVEIGTLACGAG